MRPHGAELDPLALTHMPTVTSTGKALHHVGMGAFDFTNGGTSGHITLIVATNTGLSSSVAVVYTLDPNNTGAPYSVVGTPAVIDLPTIAQASSAGGPTAGRSTKFSASLVNTSNALKCGGMVTYINTSQRLPGPTNAGPTSPTQFDAVVKAIKESPYRRRVNGKVFASCGISDGNSAAGALQLIGYPVDAPKYEEFNFWEGAIVEKDFRKHVFNDTNANPIAFDDPTASRRPMSIVAFVLENTEEEQNYSLTMRGGFYTRWPLLSVPGQSMTMIPTAPAATINSMRDHAENTASVLKPAAEIAGVGAGSAAAAYGLKSYMASGSNAAGAGRAVAQGYIVPAAEGWSALEMAEAAAAGVLAI